MNIWKNLVFMDYTTLHFLPTNLANPLTIDQLTLLQLIRIYHNFNPFMHNVPK